MTDARDTTDALDAEREVRVARPHDVHAVGAIHQLLERLNGSLHRWVVREHGLEEHVLGFGRRQARHQREAGGRPDRQHPAGVLNRLLHHGTGVELVVPLLILAWYARHLQRVHVAAERDTHLGAANRGQVGLRVHAERLLGAANAGCGHEPLVPDDRREHDAAAPAGRFDDRPVHVVRGRNVGLQEHVIAGLDLGRKTRHDLGQLQIPRIHKILLLVGNELLATVSFMRPDDQNYQPYPTERPVNCQHSFFGWQPEFY